MRGTLQYKDVHGRVWSILESDTAYNRWAGETLDQGHTEEYFHVATVLDDLIMVIDSEEYLIESRKLATQQTGQGAESVRLPEPTGTSEARETLAEISKAAKETEGNDSAEPGTLGGTSREWSDGTPVDQAELDAQVEE